MPWCALALNWIIHSELGGQLFKRGITFTNLGPSVNEKVLASIVVTLDLCKNRRQLARLRTKLELTTLSVKAWTKLLEACTNRVLLFGLSIVIFHMMGDGRLKAIQDTAPRLIWSIRRRKDMNVRMFAVEALLSKRVAQIMKSSLKLNSNYRKRAIHQIHIKKKFDWSNYK